MLLKSWKKVDVERVFSGDTLNLYTDGGVVGANPSPFGGTYAFVGVDSDDCKVFEGYGFIRPDDLRLPSEVDDGIDEVTNNVTEILAIYYALHYVRHLPHTTTFTVWTDSQIAERWWTCKHPELSPYPQAIHNLRYSVPGTLARTTFRLLAGHPSKSHLQRGIKNGLPVSPWNMLADKLCTQVYTNRWKSQREGLTV